MSNMHGDISGCCTEKTIKGGVIQRKPQTEVYWSKYKQGCGWLAASLVEKSKNIYVWKVTICAAF